MNGNYLVTAFILLPAVRSLPPLSIPKIAHKEHYGKIDNQVLHPDDELSADLVNIQQGEAGDCYFLSSAMAVAHRFPAIIKARLSDNGDGTYGGNFFGTLRGASCRVPEIDGAYFSDRQKEALWDRFYTGAPARQRQCVERYNIVKRA
jgi:hypothetical protein